MEKWDWYSERTGIAVEVKVGLRTARDLRSMLVSAAYFLSERSGGEVVCLLFNSRFSPRRLRDELALFRAVVHPDIAKRIAVEHLDSATKLPSSLLQKLRPQEISELQEAASMAIRGRPTSSSREAVVGTLLHRWITGAEPVRIPKLASLSGASVPTVYAALKTLDPALLRQDEERRISLKTFTPEAWQQWLTISTDSPAVNFVDRSGSPRSPEKLARMLSRVQRDDVAIGGVLGAKHHYPQLDITAAPFLDLVVHGAPYADLSFIAELDPALKRSDDLDSQAHVRVHFVNRPENLFEKSGDVMWADVLECMVNMWDARLIHQVQHLIDHVTPRQPRELVNG